MRLPLWPIARASTLSSITCTIISTYPTCKVNEHRSKAHQTCMSGSDGILQHSTATCKLYIYRYTTSDEVFFFLFFETEGQPGTPHLMKFHTMALRFDCVDVHLSSTRMPQIYMTLSLSGNLGCHKVDKRRIWH